MRLGLGLAVVGVVLAEIKLANRGLGFLAIEHYSHFRIADMYAVVLLIFGLAVAANGLMGGSGPGTPAPAGDIIAPVASPAPRAAPPADPGSGRPGSATAATRHVRHAPPEERGAIMEPTTDEAQAFYKELERNHLVALWTVTRSLLPKEPRSRCVPHLWRWETMRALVERGAAMTPLSRQAERRVLGFINPGLPDRCGATHTLWAGFQYVLPGEVAPAHRHSPAAIRFVLQGRGAFTAVDGDKCLMEPGDLVLTPPWTWHDHGNESGEPILWLDGLDLPLVAEMEAQFYEPFPAEAQPIGRPVGDSEHRYGIGQLRPTWEKWTAPYSPLLNYKWARTEEGLRRLAAVAGEASPFDDVAMEYVNPHTGGPLMPTLACGIQLIRPGVRTRAHRHTGSAVYQVFAGRGTSVIDGQRFDWATGDLFVVPTWAWHEHASAGGEAILFSVQDTPVLQALGLHREQAYPAHGGHQPVTRAFEG